MERSDSVRPGALDASGRLRLSQETSLFVSVKNLTDEVYVVARRPAGARPGLPRMVLGGLQIDF